MNQGSYSVLTVATWILEDQGPMEALKLQKLVYYSDAESLFLFGRPLINENFEAWAFGPVVYELFKRHQGSFIVSNVGNSNEILSPVAIQAICGALTRYGTKTGRQLSKQTHSETPWLKARAGLDAHEIARVPIDRAEMQSFYSSKYDALAFGKPGA